MLLHYSFQCTSSSLPEIWKRLVKCLHIGRQANGDRKELAKRVYSEVRNPEVESRNPKDWLTKESEESGEVHSSKLAVLCGHRIDEVWLMARFNVRRVIKAVDLCARCHLRHDLRTPITTAPATLNFHLFNPWLSAHKIEPSLSAALSPSQMLLLRPLIACLSSTSVDN